MVLTTRKLRNIFFAHDAGIETGIYARNDAPKQHGYTELKQTNKINKQTKFGSKRTEFTVVAV